MSEGISRRNLVAATGAAVVLTACDQGSATGSKSADEPTTPEIKDASTVLDTKFKPASFESENKDFRNARDPHRAPPAGWLAFTPKFIHIVHIRSPRPWLFEINQAHFELPADVSDNDGRLKFAKATLSEKLTKKNDKFSKNEINKVYTRKIKEPKGTYVEEFDARNLLFGQQHQIFFFIEGGNLTFNPDNIISFKENRVDGKIGAENHAFFNTKVFSTSNDIDSLSKLGRFIRIDNYYTGSDGKALQSDALYAMNFHFGQEVQGGQPAQMIFDPDTGNGAGNEP